MKSVFSLLVSLSLLSISTLTVRAELLFYEPFDFGPGVTTLGYENGWQMDFNRDEPSMASLHSRNAQEASPFEPRGLALQLTSSKEVAYRKLPVSLNGKNAYFSFSMKPFTTKGTSIFWFRSSDGFPVRVGMQDGVFNVISGTTDLAGPSMDEKKSYFIVGQIETSPDGKMIAVAANIYTSAVEVPSIAPSTTKEWLLLNIQHYAKDRQWDGVGFYVGSSNAAFDDLRIGTTWEDVTGKKSLAY